MTTWTTREAAEKCGLSQHTLRWYERSACSGRSTGTPTDGAGSATRDLDWLALLTKLRATGMPVADMQRYAELVRSGAGEQERLELLRATASEVRRALAAQRECLKLLDSKIGTYSRAGWHAAGADGQEQQKCAR